MSVSQENPASASEHNTLRSNVNKAFADNYSSVSYGNGNQIYGWGGSEVASISAGNLIYASEKNSLVDRCNIGQDIVNNVSGTLPQIVSEDVMTAAEFNNIETKANNILTYVNNIEAAELSLHSGGTITRSSIWSSAINATFRYSFSNFNKSRYFWNSGGAINIDMTITGYATGMGWDGSGFNMIFRDMGTILMNYTQTTQSGSGGTPTSFGFYDLSTGYQNIFSQTGSGAYSDATLVLAARYGSSGAYIEFRVTLTPGSGRSVNGTTGLTTQYRKLDNQSSGVVSLTITAPSYSLINNF